MKSVQRLILTVILCSTMAMPIVYAKDESNRELAGGHERREKMIEQIYGQLNLTQDQRKRLEVNKQHQKEMMKNSFEQMKSQRETLHQELMKSQLDMNKVNSIHAKLKGTQAQMMDHRLNSILEVRKILTPEQFDKFHLLMKEQRPKVMRKGVRDEDDK